MTATESGRGQRPTLQRLVGLPAFAGEAEEAAFWDAHDLGEGVLDQFGTIPEAVLPTRARSVPIAVYFDTDILRRLRALARKKGTGYQALLKEFVLERLHEEEKREGILKG